jgi:transcriptional regulator with XRE-family HTH domain
MAPPIPLPLFAVRIVKARGTMSPSELARQIGVSKQVLSRWETGRKKYLEPGYALRIADVLGCSAAWLLGLTDDNKIIGQ